MRTVTWATFPEVGSPMGLQTYEAHIISELQQLEPEGWSFRRRTVASLRSRDQPDVRVPLGLLDLGGGPAARAAGRWAYRGCRRVHRFDLRLPPAPGPEVVTVHDLPPLRFDDEGDLPPWTLSSARSARAVICPSEFAAQEVRSLLGVQNTVIIYNGHAEAGPPAALSPPDRVRLGLHPTRPYVLHAGGATKRKNLAALAGAWSSNADLSTAFDLVLAGPPDPRRDALFGSLPNARTIGFHPRETIARLMSAASCVVVPSVYEGFGLPALEAMSVGTPVVAAARGALPEVCGDAALLCEPDEAGLAHALRSVLSDPALARRLEVQGRERASAFSWTEAARRHLLAYDEFLA